MLLGYTNDIAGSFVGRHPNELLLTLNTPQIQPEFSIPKKDTTFVSAIGVAMPALTVLSVNPLTAGAFALTLGQLWIHGPEAFPPRPPAVPDGTYLFTVQSTVQGVYVVAFASALIKNLPVIEEVVSWGDWWAPR